MLVSALNPFTDSRPPSAPSDRIVRAGFNFAEAQAEMFFDSFATLGRILVVGTLAYVALVIILRISGKRTLSKLNAFDLVVTVALGSTLSTMLLSKETALADGVLALALLVLLQFLIAFLSVRSQGFRRLIKADPALLVHRGRFLDDVMKSERITQEDVLAAIRTNGIASASQVSVVLETDGSMSVVRMERPDTDVDALRGVAMEGGPR